MKKSVFKIMMGILMVTTVVIGYLPQIAYLVELTCISNTLGGLLLIADGILDMAGKRVQLNAFYLNVVMCILIVFFICLVSLTGTYYFNFSGAFFFMHVLNPLVFAICYLLFVNEQNRSSTSLLTSPMMIMTYLLFDYMRAWLTGEFVYGFIHPKDLTLVWAIIAAVVIYILMYLLGLMIFTLNRFVHKKANIFHLTDINA